MSELEDFLKENSEPEEGSPEAPKEAPAEVQAEPAPAPDETPKESAEPKTESAEPTKETVEPEGEDAAPPAAEESQKSVPVAALEAERHKRQEAEKVARDIELKIATLEGRLNEVQRPKPEEPAETPSFLDDPEAAHAAMQKQFKQEIEKNRINNSVAVAKVRFTDFEEVFDEFQAMMAADPIVKALGESIYMAVKDRLDPGADFYQAVKRLVPEKTPEAAVVEKVTTDLAEAKAAEAKQLPASLVEERNVGTRSGPEWAGPPKDDELNIGKGLS